MKIEKKKYADGSKFSFAKKSAIATVLGMAAVFSLNACDDSTSASEGNSNHTTGPESSGATVPTSSSDEATPASSESASAVSSQEQKPSSSSQEQAPETSSQQQSPVSSSNEVVVDIPLSHEPISSSVMEALSAAAEASSSSTVPTPASAADTTTSSSADTASSAAGPESSSETVQPESSSESVNPASSSSQPSIWDIYDACEGLPRGSSVDIGGNVYLCPDGIGGAMGSMVTTFERDDIEV